MSEQNRSHRNSGNRNNQPRRPDSRNNQSRDNNNQRRSHPQQQRQQGQSQGQGSRPQHNQRRHHPNQRHHHQQRSPQQSGGGNIDQMLMQYDRLVEQHIEARKKYFELFYRADYHRRNKLEDQFFLTSQNLIRFQTQLAPWQLKELQKHRTDIYTLDNIYSSNHPEGENLPAPQLLPESEFHLTSTQLSRSSYKEDTEISVGTMEDYISYKASVQK